MTIVDYTGNQITAPLYMVSANQINFQIPPETAAGKVIALVSSNNLIVATAILDIEPVSPGLFTVAGGNQTAAVVQRVSADGAQSVEAVTGKIDLGPPTDQVFLVLFGTGIRNRSSLTAVTASAGGQQLTVSFAGPQANSPGLDQVNLLLPRTLIGAGQVEIALSMDGWNSNRVTINIR